jgi:hypothetical protein
MSRKLAVCLSGLALAFALPSLTSAQVETPHLKAGLWDAISSLGGIKVDVHMCMDDSAQSRAAAFRLPAVARGGPNCSQKDTKQIPGGMDMEMICTIKGRPAHISMVVKGDFQSRYTMDMTMQPQGGPETRITTTSHWVGACPADMKPGQVISKMDFGSLAAAAAAAGQSEAPAAADAR